MLLVLLAEVPLIDLDGTVVVQLVLFLALLLLLDRLLYRPYLRLQAARDRATEGLVEQGERLEAAARARLADLEKHLVRAKTRAAEERVRVRTEAAARQREIVEVAASEASQRQRKAREDLDRKAADLRARLAPEMDALAATIVDRVIGKGAAT